jgi:hypothetical protein
MEPHTLPLKYEGKSLIVTYFLRFFSILLFALFTSKCIEANLFGWTVENDSQIHLGEIDQITLLNQQYPIIWLFTVLIVFLFLSPILLKNRLNKTSEYYSIKKRRDIRMVIREYDNFRLHLDSKYETLYKSYNNSKIKFKMHPVRFEDEPFNTVRLVVNKSYKSTEEFIDLYDFE